MYGRGKYNIELFLLCIVFLLAIIAFTTIRIVKDKEYASKKSNALQYISIIIIVSITLFYGVEIYKSATNYGGKLAWTLDRLKNEKTVKFEHNNIYKYGVEGIFEDINKKYSLPKKLYITNEFELTFNSVGTITSLYTFVYGRNESGKEESFLITFDNKSQKLTVRLNGYTGATYDDNKLLEPLIKTVNVIPVQFAVSKWNESEYGLVYFGKRSWGSNIEGIININEEGKEHPLKHATSEKIIGYTVSIFVPGKEKEIIPARYNLIGDASLSKINTNPDYFKELQQENNEEPFFLSKKVGYQLNFVDKALGSTLYSLSKTINGGETWEVINKDPFMGVVGSVSGMTFLNDKLGFIGALNPSSTAGELYRTDDGGVSFNKVLYVPHEVKLDSGQSISPFDSPDMPYEKDGVLIMLVGQGSDGDYNGNSRAQYQSKDNGETWEYVKEVK